MRTPLEIMLSVEDNIDHPAHDISERLARKVLEALDAEGWALVPKNQTEPIKERRPSLSQPKGG